MSEYRHVSLSSCSAPVEVVVLTLDGKYMDPNHYLPFRPAGQSLAVLREVAGEVAQARERRAVLEKKWGGTLVLYRGAPIAVVRSSTPGPGWRSTRMKAQGEGTIPVWVPNRRSKAARQIVKELAAAVRPTSQVLSWRLVGDHDHVGEPHSSGAFIVRSIYAEGDLDALLAGDDEAVLLAVPKALLDAGLVPPDAVQLALSEYHAWHEARAEAP